jgi:hypothetical protein
MGRSTSTAIHRFRPSIDTMTFVTSGSSGLHRNFQPASIQQYINSLTSIPGIASILNTSNRTKIYLYTNDNAARVALAVGTGVNATSISEKWGFSNALRAVGCTFMCTLLAL